MSSAVDNRRYVMGGNGGGGSSSSWTPEVPDGAELSGGGVSGAPGGDCYRVVLDANVMSLAPDLEPALEVGDILDVVLTDAAPRRLELRRDEVVVGTIVSQFAVLLACIERGVEFQAEVTQDAAPVAVRVTALQP